MRKLLTVCLGNPMGQDENAFNDCAVVIGAGTTLYIGRRRPQSG
ncbi:hypothetical protein ACFWBN_34700 [Streptomyces sp. NPDC059989]